ncbi:MAG: tetratricopeptide repeat protein [Vulcanimicrobiota bacterium]
MKRRCIAALILFLSLSFPVQADDGESFFREGLKAFKLNKFEISLPYFQKARDWFKEHRRIREEASALCCIGSVHRELNNLESAIAAHREALTLLESLNDEKGRVAVQNALGDLFLMRSDTANARQYAEEALKGAEALKDNENVAHALLSLGSIEQSEGNALKARTVLERCCALSRELKDKTILSSALGSLGILQNASADYDGAEASLTEALSLHKKSGNKFNEGVVLTSLGTVYRNRGNLQKALQYFENALIIAHEMKNRMLESSVTSYLGSVLEKRGDPEKALKYYEKSLALKKELDNPPILTVAMNDIGVFHWNRGNFKEALSYFNEALRNAEKFNLAVITPALLINKASVINAMGDCEEALRIFQEALELVRKREDRAREAIVLNNLGNIYYRLSYYQKSREMYESSLSIAQSIGNRTGEAITLSNLGQLFSACDDTDRALEYYRKAYELQRDLNDTQNEARSLNNMGQLYAYKAIKQPLLYQKASKILEEAMILARKAEDTSLEGAIESNMGYIALDTNQYERAIALFTASADKARIQGDRQSEAFNLASLGLTYDSMGREEKACELYIKAVEIIESLASRFKVDEYKRQFLKDHQYFYSRLIDLLRKMDKDSDAFIYNERSRSRALLDMLSPVNVAVRKNRLSSTGGIERMAERERQLREEIASLEASPGPLVNAERVRKIERLVNEHKDLLIQLTLRDPGYAQLVSIQPPSLKEIQRSIPQDSMLLEYYAGTDAVILWAVTGDSITTFTVSSSPQSLYQKVAGLRQSIVSSCDGRPEEMAAFSKSSKEMYGILISPAERILKGKKNLIIVPHDFLHYLPFAALLSSRDQYLIRNHTVTYAPSASIWLLCLHQTRPAPEKLVAFASGGNTPSSLEPSVRDSLRLRSSSGDYLKDFPPLPGTIEEVKQIAALYEKSESYVEKDMTLEKVKKTTGDASIIHFATHGILNSSHPVFSGLLLRDTVLSVPDIFRLNLSAALVVLSGCNTALGEDSLGNEMLGISRSFMYAGTPSVLATLWTISDESSVLFMKEFHRHFREGKSKAESLREAQRSVEVKYPSPMHWAPFILIGDGNR